MNEIQLINANAARVQLANQIARNRLQLMVIHQVIDSLRSMEGKALNKHLANALTRYHPSLKFYVASPHSWYSLDIEGEGFDSIELMLCYKSEPAVVNVARIEKGNERYLIDEKRIPEYEEELKTIEERVERYNAAVRELVAAHEGLGEGRFAFTENDKPRVKDDDGRYII
jgi:DNA repair ATPase RecN